MRLLFSSYCSVGGIAFPTSCVFNTSIHTDTSLQPPLPPPRPAQGCRFRLQPLPPSPASVPSEPHSGEDGVSVGHAAPGTRTAPGDGALCLGDIPKVSPKARARR